MSRNIREKLVVFLGTDAHGFRDAPGIIWVAFIRVEAIIREWLLLEVGAIKSN